MSDWMLYHVWGIRGYEVVRHDKLDRDCLAFSLRATPQVLRCPRCGSKDVVRKGTNSRLFRGLPVGRKQVWFDAAIPRVRCDRCQLTRQVRIPFAEEKRRHTRQFERYALELAQITTTQHAADHLGVAWDTVRDIEARFLHKKYSKPKLRHLKQLAIDEIYLGKSVKFLTVVLDLESGAIVFLGRGNRSLRCGTEGWPRSVCCGAHSEVGESLPQSPDQRSLQSPQPSERDRPRPEDRAGAGPSARSGH